MIHNRIDFNKDVATDVRFFNPFGPNMLYMSLDDHYVNDLLKIVNKLSSRQDIKDRLDAEGQIVQGTRAEANQNNSIVDGEMYPIHPDDVEPNENKTIVDLISNLTLMYGDVSSKQAMEDITLKDDVNAINSLKSEAESFQVKIDSIWYVRLKQGDFHILHEHSGSGATLSGAIYLDIPDLPWPQGTMNWIPPGGQNTLYNGTWQTKPKAGDVFIWPSWLLHTVFPFRGDGERIMISFNTNLLSPKDKKVS